MRRQITCMVISAWVCGSALATTDHPISRYIQYGFELKNDSSQIIRGAELWAYAPVKETSHQVCTDIRASHPFEILEDELGNQILHFTFEAIPPYRTVLVSIEADMALSDAAAKLADSPERFLAPEPYVEFDDPEFQKLAPRFSSLDEAGRISETFRWVSNHVRDTGYGARDRGALYALKHRSGDCSEFMYLFTALCRQQHIPARGVEGYICKQNKKLHPAAYHSWAEVHDGTVWKLADPLAGVFEESASQYIAMRIVGNVPGPIKGHHRFHYQGRGLKVTMNK